MCLWNSEVVLSKPHYLFILGIFSVANGQSYVHTQGVVVTKAPFVNFSASTIFDLAKVTVRFVESHSYLTGVTAAELRQHQSNINMIFNNKRVFQQCWKIAIRPFKVPISWLRIFTRSHEKTSFRILRRGPGINLFSSGHVMAEWLAHWPPQWMAKGVSEI